MKYVDEFRNKEICQSLAKEISEIADGRDATLMEVCGTHTMAISRYGIKSLLPPNIRLLSGPGCPVCVTPNSDIDRAIAYSKKNGTGIATFGDMVKVPGSSSSLSKEKSIGRDVRVVYSSTDAVRLALENPEKRVIFLGVGFETTAPTVAAYIKDAKDRGLKNYFVLSMHKLIPPALKALLDSKEVRIDGFILPGHVSTITGTRVYEFIPQEYGVCCVVAGFEPVDVLQAILMLVRQVRDKRPGVENQYTRSVKEEGNPKAKLLLKEVFEPSNSEWRGLGVIPESGLKIKEEYADFDAERNIPVKIEKSRENPKCICGEVLRGVKSPLDCSLFKRVCTPQSPVGPCMVSSEGTCSAYYKYADDRG